MRLSVCTIMKNEEKNIGRMIDSCLNAGIAAKDISLVDTGSEDGSVEEAKKHGVTPSYLEWPDDFSKAKNHAISLAKNDIVLVLDADEYLEEADLKEIESLYTSLPDAFVCTITVHHRVNTGGIDNIHNETSIRLFDRRKFHYIHSVHEQVVSIDGTSFAPLASHITAAHTGYILSEEAVHKKALRNLKLLMSEHENDPNDLYTIFQIGQTYLFDHDEKNALPWFEKAMEHEASFDPANEYMQMIITGYGQCLKLPEDKEKALALRRFDPAFGQIPEYTFMMGSMYMTLQMWGEACGMFMRCISLKENRLHGATSFFPYHNLGVISELLGEKEIAKNFYRMSGDYKRSADRLKELEEEQV